MRGRRIEEKLGELERLVREALVWKEFAKELQEEKRELLDRLAARSLGELKTYTAVRDVAEPMEYDPMEDEGLAGTVMLCD